MLHLRKVLKAKPRERVPMEPRVLYTPWGEALDAEHVLEEHPQPQFAREAYTVLNGPWTCAFVASGHEPVGDLATVCATAEEPCAERFSQQIVVPFSPEAPLSGVGRQLQPDELLWYRRSFAASPAEGRRLLLHFQAVDYACAVRVNGALAGTHTGGYLPFSFDITDLVHEGENELCVCVADPTEFGWQPRGKQRTDHSGIWYSAQSGIWQSVWLEEVPAAYVSRLRILEASAAGDLRARVHLEVPTGLQDGQFKLSVLDGDRVVAEARCKPSAVCAIELHVPDVKPWSPEDPHLYRLLLELGEDRVESYCGFRTIEVRRDAANTPRLWLNGEPLFIRGVLDQGYWPDGLLTAPSDEALVFDIEAMRDAGFNTLRKHIKVESARWYYHCDRLGMLVWQDMVSGGDPVIDDWVFSYQPTLFKPSWSRYSDTTDAHRKRLGAGDAAYRAEWRATCKETMRELMGHPSLVIWTLFNEGWGQFDSAAAYEMARGIDATRPIVATSGWYDQGAGDIRGVHNYFRDMRVWRDRRHGRPFAVSEFGGFAHHVAEHSVMDDLYGYEVYEDCGAWQKAVRGLLAEMDALEPKGLVGYVYTQVSDIEEEINGILTYDRRVNKLD